MIKHNPEEDILEDSEELIEADSERKQLEKEFKDAAYATIYSFVMKFEELGLLTSVKYGARIKYKIS